MSGDCFIVAAKAVLDDADLTLVHGDVWADGSGTAPVGYHPHAWTERTTTIIVPVGHDPDAAPIVVTATVCIDRSNGHDAELPEAMYYKAGRIDHHRTRRYTRAEVAALIDNTGHWGPWPQR